MPGTILIVDKHTALHAALANAAPRLRLEFVTCHQTAQASAELAEGRVRVLVAGPSCLTTAGMRFLRQVHEERPEIVTLLAANGAEPDVPPRELIRAGASDLIRYPGSAKALRSALERAVAMAEAIGGSARRADRTATTLTITSPSGGSGKTFFATNLAYELAIRSGGRVALVDLDLQFGEVNTALRLHPEFTIHDLVNAGPAGRHRHEDDEDFSRRLADVMVAHDSGLEVLSAPSDPALADSLTAPEVQHVVQAMKARYDYVIVDTPAALTEAVLAAMDLSERLIVLGTLDLPSVKNLGVFLSTFDRLKVPRDTVSLVLNKAERGVGLSPNEVSRALNAEFTGVLPYAREVSKSFNTGRPILQSSRHSAIGRALLDTFSSVVPEGALHSPPTLEGQSGRFRFLRRSA